MQEEPPLPDVIQSVNSATRYELKREIAVGGMGAVYEAEQHGACGFVKTIAVKTILPRYSQEAMFVGLFVEEAKLVADLVHPNIVQIYQLGQHEGGYFIAMEYIDGINLEQFSKRHKDIGQPVPVDLATFIVSRICRGLDYAHSKRDRHGHLLGIVHRDVCPRNIMITREGECKLTDFGVAKARRYMHDVEGEYIIGKDAYMSPEQAALQPTDGRSDLYSLGVVYFELLTGIHGFTVGLTRDPQTPGRLRPRRACEPQQYREDLPDDVLHILDRSLRTDPDERFSNASEMAVALEMAMYAKGYGPTIVKLARYLDEVFPDSPPVSSTSPVDVTVIIPERR